MPAVQQTDQNSGDIAERLLAHYDVHARTLPWRKLPGQGFADPYHVWLSEIMLQQTTVAAVGAYFRTFTQTWPNFAALAAADDADVMGAWAGLGYYARARNLLKCARVVVSEYQGQLPSYEADLLKLPGIGPYTAAASAAIAFGRRAVVVDANDLLAVQLSRHCWTQLVRNQVRVLEGFQNLDLDQATNHAGKGVDVQKCCRVNAHAGAFQQGLGHGAALWRKHIPPVAAHDPFSGFLNAELLRCQAAFTQPLVTRVVPVVVALGIT